MPVSPSNAAPTDNTVVNIILLLACLLVGCYLIYLAVKKTNIDPPDWWHKNWDSYEPEWPRSPVAPGGESLDHLRHDR